MGLFGSTKKRRRKYTNQALAAFRPIVEKYGLGMEESEYRYIAEAIGDAKAKAKKGIFGGFNILGVVFSVVGSIFTGGILGIVTGAVGLVANKITTTNALKAQDLALRADAGFRKAAWQRAFNDSKDSGRLSNIISRKDYAIYADGSIFRQNAPGSESYSPSIAYDTSKGLRQDLKEDKVDEMIMTRDHYVKGGNDGYIGEVSEGWIEKGDGGITVRESQDATMINAGKNSDRIYKGFVELVGVGFDFCGTANKHYQDVIQRQVWPFYRKICSEDFLDKNKNYNRALRLELPMHMDDLTKTKETTQEERDKAFKNSEAFKRVVEADLKAWENEAEQVNLRAEIEALKKELGKENQSGGEYYFLLKKIQQKQEAYKAKKEAKRKEIEEELFKSEKALMAGDFYIQKSRLYTLEEKKQNYTEMVEAKIALFISKVGRLTFYESNAFNNARFKGREFFYNTHLEWVNQNSKNIDDFFDAFYENDSEENIVSFYESYVLNNFDRVEFRNNTSENAFYLDLNGKRYIKIVKSDIKGVLEPIYKGF